MKEEIYKAIKSGELFRAMSMMHDYSTSSNYGNITHELFLHQSILSRSEVDYAKGFISREDYEKTLNRITVALLSLVDKIFISINEYIPDEKAQYFTLFYSTDRRKVVSFQVIFDSGSRRVAINKTRSKSDYKGKYYLYSNHTCLTVENNTKYCINLILYTGPVFPHENQEICIGIVNLIGMDGVACSSSAVLKVGKIEKVEKNKNNIIKQFILHRPILGIHNSIKGIFNEKDLKRKIDFSVLKDFAGNYRAIIVSGRRKMLIPFALKITELGMLYSYREPKELSNLEGIVHVIDRNTVTINVYLNHQDEKIFAEFRVFLDTSRQAFKKFNFYRGTYSSISYRGKEPRGGRCIMIKTEENDIEKISTEPIALDSKEFKEMTKEYPRMIDYLKGQYDNYVENFDKMIREERTEQNNGSSPLS